MENDLLNLTDKELEILRVFKGKNMGLNASEISIITNIHRSNLLGYLERLEKKGLIYYVFGFSKINRSSKFFYLADNNSLKKLLEKEKMKIDALYEFLSEGNKIIPKKILEDNIIKKILEELQSYPRIKRQIIKKVFIKENGRNK